MKKNAPESKVTPVSYSAVSPLLKLKMEHSVSEPKRERKVLGIHQGTNMIDCVLPGNTAHAAFDKGECI